MAVKQMRQCDHCGRMESSKLEVLQVDAKISDGTRVVGDLCRPCLNECIKTNALTTTNKRRRSTFKVTEIE